MAKENEEKGVSGSSQDYFLHNNWHALWHEFQTKIAACTEWKEGKEKEKQGKGGVLSHAPLAFSL